MRQFIAMGVNYIFVDIVQDVKIMLLDSETIFYNGYNQILSGISYSLAM